uniref:VWFD domain-containing protein n=1 Tax=Electrophorus electricus TaxID=8005 RepID=A0A4W4DVB5_ELEEL
FFQLPYTCNYVLATLCDSTKMDFNIQLRRQYVNNIPTIISFTIKLEGTVIKLLNVTLPSFQRGVRFEKTTSYIKISSKLELTVFWDEVELSTKYRNQTCGLCGDFNGITYDEFIENGARLNSNDYGHKWKLDAPTEMCEEVNEHETSEKCQSEISTCHNLLSSPAFNSCQDLLSIQGFMDACVIDACHCNSNTTCLCDTITEFSRQCAHAGGKPQKWRTDTFCAKNCPFNMLHSECEIPCTDTCSNQEGIQLCTDHCIDGCFCPAGTVLDDIGKTGCIPVDQCPCSHNGKKFKPGESYTKPCHKCECSKGRWHCKHFDCPGTCTVKGSHVTTYDGKAYTFHGKCYYTLTKVTAICLRVMDIYLCTFPDLKAMLNKDQLVGKLWCLMTHCSLIFLSDQVTIFRSSTFFIIAKISNLRLEIQLVPVMQLYIVASSASKTALSGLCGNFNDNDEDDFMTNSGIKESIAMSFADKWSVNCKLDAIMNKQDPCSMSVEKEKYAKEWCTLISNANGIFAKCHVVVDPKDYKDRCMYDSCNCVNSEDCMCAAISSYVRACAAKGVLINGWRDIACGTYSKDCPSDMEYFYNVSSCGTTCRSLSGQDHTCLVTHTPLDGCSCARGTYLTDEGKCVSPSSCPCYSNNKVVAPMNVIIEDGVTWYKHSLTGSPVGVECQKSCKTQDFDQSGCKSGCVCPNGLLADGQGGCQKEEDCPCFYNGISYKPKETVKSDCNTCTCKNRKWDCTDNVCFGTCSIYGDGHFKSFDGRRYSFSGDCEYMLVQDYCGSSLNGSFRVITENVPCGTTGTTCSKSIKVYLGVRKLHLSEEDIKVTHHQNVSEIPYHIHTVGIYMVIEAKNGLALFWDKKTSVMIKLSPSFKGKVCGLCGNFDGNGKNDFVTRSGEEVVEQLEFGNSWRISPTCPKANSVNSSCDMRPHRQAWAIKQCSIIKSDIFENCHSFVDHTQYYDTCVQDTCACDTGGDCECFCTAVAAYAAACSEQGVCVLWRSPTICPLFCDYYNSREGCEWHYKPCGQSCMKTCENPSGVCFNKIPPLEGTESTGTTAPEITTATTTIVPSPIPISSPSTTESTTIQPSTAVTHMGSTTETSGTESTGTTAPESPTTTTTIVSKTTPLSISPKTSTKISPPTSETPSTTPLATSSTKETTATTFITASSKSPSTTTSIIEISTITPPSCMKCTWSEWLDSSYPDSSPTGGEIESIAAMWSSRKIPCQEPMNIQCRAKEYEDIDLRELGQIVICNASIGLICENSNQTGIACFNYEIRVMCCNNKVNKECTTPSPTTTTTLETSTSEPSITTPIPTTTTTIVSSKTPVSSTGITESTTEKPSTTVTHLGSTTETSGTESTGTTAPEIPTTTTTIVSSTTPVSSTGITESTTEKTSTTVTQVGSTTETSGTESTGTTAPEIPTTTTTIVSSTTPVSSTGIT